MKNKAEELIDQAVDLEKPGFAQHYCIHCAKYFIDEHSITEHYRTKVHKRRMKALELEPYGHEEAERAAGHGNWVEAKKRKLATQPTKEEMKAGKKLCVEVIEKVKPEEEEAAAETSGMEVQA